VSSTCFEHFIVLPSIQKKGPVGYVARLYGTWSLRLKNVWGSVVQLGLTAMLSRENDTVVYPVFVLYKAIED
jgi:hypothetical protein